MSRLALDFSLAIAIFIADGQFHHLPAIQEAKCRMKGHSRKQLRKGTTKTSECEQVKRWQREPLADGASRTLTPCGCPIPEGP